MIAKRCSSKQIPEESVKNGRIKDWSKKLRVSRMGSAEEARGGEDEIRARKTSYLWNKQTRLSQTGLSLEPEYCRINFSNIG
jgi:hypothetical protein